LPRLRGNDGQKPPGIPPGTTHAHLDRLGHGSIGASAITIRDKNPSESANSSGATSVPSHREILTKPAWPT
jgi:hypothetical protein